MKTEEDFKAAEKRWAAQLTGRSLVIEANADLEQAAPEDRPDVLLRERSLLYVAASRARDQLLVTWAGQPSELLVGSET
jgi:superfamily I DNA/RNA helicase